MKRRSRWRGPARFWDFLDAGWATRLGLNGQLFLDTFFSPGEKRDVKKHQALLTLDPLDNRFHPGSTVAAVLPFGTLGVGVAFVDRALAGAAQPLPAGNLAGQPMRLSPLAQAGVLPAEPAPAASGAARYRAFYPAALAEPVVTGPARLASAASTAGSNDAYNYSILNEEPWHPDASFPNSRLGTLDDLTNSSFAADQDDSSVRPPTPDNSLFPNSGLGQDNASASVPRNDAPLFHDSPPATVKPPDPFPFVPPPASHKQIIPGAASSPFTLPTSPAPTGTAKYSSFALSPAAPPVPSLVPTGGGTGHRLPPGPGPLTESISGSTSNFSGTETYTLPATSEVATFRDSDLDQNPGHFSATIDFGDGSPQVAGSIAWVDSDFDRSDYYVSTLADHLYKEDGTYTTTIKITDTDGPAAYLYGTVTVADAALNSLTVSNFSANAGFTSSLNIATFRDGNANGQAIDFSTVITWGDGQTSSGTVTGSGTGPYTVAASHTYYVWGTYTVGVAVVDGASQISTTMYATVSQTASNLLGDISGQLTGEFDYGTGAISPLLGNLRVSMPLDFRQSPANSAFDRTAGLDGNPALVYDSASISSRPIVEATVVSNSYLGVPTSIQRGTKGTRTFLIDFVGKSVTGSEWLLCSNPDDLYLTALRPHQGLSGSSNFSHAPAAGRFGNSSQTLAAARLLRSRSWTPMD